ncbi:separin protein [Oleoguttula sp. CCFEE 5521]
MASAQYETVKVKEEIAGLRATEATAQVLQQFLKGDRTGPEPSSTRRVKSLQPNAPRTKATGPISRDDGSELLSNKQRYSFATEVINISLKVLTESAKARGHGQVPRQQHGHTTDHAEKRQALLSRSANSTPSKTTSPLTKSAVHRPASDRNADEHQHVVATATCARTAFAFLRSSEAATISKKDVTSLQLESGMLALVAKLLANDLVDLAIKQLRLIKHSLGSVCGAPKDVVPARETLAGLLNVHSAVVVHKEALALAITYQILVLRTLRAACKPRSIEACVDLLDPTSSLSPFGLIMAQHSVTGDVAKTLRALSALSSAVLDLCPSSSSKADEQATDVSKQPTPDAVLRLQAMALKTRQLEWSLSSPGESRNHVHEPLARCVAAYAVTTLDLSVPSNGMAAMPILRTLSSLAEEAQMPGEALSWTEQIVVCLCSLDEGHAQRIAAVTRVARLQSSSASVIAAICDIDVALRKKMSGGLADYEMLLTELAQLCSCFSDYNDAEINKTAVDSLLITSASFAQRCFRTWPGKSTGHVKSILSIALRYTPSQEDGTVWITRDAAKALCDTEMIQALTLSAETQSSDLVWAHSSQSLSLARVLRMLVSQGMKSTSTATAEVIYDDDNLASFARYLLLEFQLKAVLEYASRPKYRESAGIVLTKILRRLQDVVMTEEHPVRHLATACLLLRFHDAHGDVLTAKHVEPWLSVGLIRGDPGADSGLCKYIDGLNAEWQLVQLLRSGHLLSADTCAAIALLERSFGIPTAQALGQNCVWDVEAVRLTLSAVAYYHSAFEEDTASLHVLQLLHKLNRIVEAPVHTLDTSIRLANAWMCLGFVEKADDAIKHVAALAADGGCSDLSKMSYRLALAEISIATDKYDDCKAHMLELEALRGLLPPNKVTREQRASYERIHAQGYLTHATWSLATGAPHEALAGAKHAVKILNSIWHRFEGPGGPQKQFPGSDAATVDEEMVDLASGVSKLQLIPKDHPPPSVQSKGTPFWPLVPLLSKALIMLSDLYVHHGLISEATYYSTKAIEVAGAVGPSPLLSRARSHRALLLTLAGDTAGAELCLASDEESSLSTPSLAAVARLRAKGAILTQERSFRLAIDVYGEIERIIGKLCSDASILELSQGSGTTPQTVLRLVEPAQPLPNPKRGPAARPPRTQARTTATTGGRNKRTAISEIVAKAEPSPCVVATSSCHLLGKLSFDIACAKVQVQLIIGDGSDGDLTGMHFLPADIARQQRSGRLQARQYLVQVARDLQADITYNVLPEAALAWPALLPSKLPVKPATKSITSKASSSRIKQAVTVADKGLNTLAATLQKACKCLQSDSAGSTPYASTAALHRACSLRCSTMMPLSALPSMASSGVQLSEGMSVAAEQARIIATIREASAIAVDLRHDTKGSPFKWPELHQATASSEAMDVDFQARYVDILPEPWTAVSLTLDEDCRELVISRYRRSQSPTFLRLPFARHKPEDTEEEKFDYHTAKSEIQEIIQRSNASCHNNVEMSSKGAKSSWWTERETLNRRLRELLLNMEEIWLGGFRGIFSTAEPEADDLLRVRKDLVAILDRHLPSRQTTRGKANGFELDDSVLELFVSLRRGVDEDSDIDELATDLLYFVVDLLQLKGERNAYDEIDFDSMTIETLDALRSVEAPNGSSSEDEHLILVLDKRLQIFPWENLPCLQTASVSRVNSMLTLRKCIMAMRSEISDGRHTVPRKSGAYILNPSLDLSNTQTMLEPALRKAAARDSVAWTSIVKRAPSEDEFKTVLQTANMTLYFGHGAGSQYIRPRTIAKLDKCSEVVWLMGCSSGAVTEHGELEPQAVPLSYLMAGSKSDTGGVDDTSVPITQNSRCLAVLATLWDVTDKDIDRFSLAVGEEWGLFEASPGPSRLPTKTPKKRDRMLAPSTPQQVAKTPKTPKVKKTPAVAPTPARGTSKARRTAGRSVSLVEAVSKSRDACYLRYLNGAAPVVYGVPVYLGD